MKIHDPVEKARIAKYGESEDDIDSDDEMIADRDYRGREINKRIPDAAKTMKDLIHIESFK